MASDHTIDPSLPSTTERIFPTADALTMARRLVSTIAFCFSKRATSSMIKGNDP